MAQIIVFYCPANYGGCDCSAWLSNDQWPYCTLPGAHARKRVRLSTRQSAQTFGGVIMLCAKRSHNERLPATTVAPARTLIYSHKWAWENAKIFTMDNRARPLPYNFTFSYYREERRRKKFTPDLSRRRTLIFRSPPRNGLPIIKI